MARHAILSPEPVRTDPAAPTRIGWRLLLACLALGLFWLWRLDAAALFDVDEGAFAEASREMLASGDWGHTTLNGLDRFDKPILVYWLQAAGLALLGPTEAAVRLPSALSAWLWCIVVGHFAWQRFGRRVGIAAAGLLATAMGVVIIGRAATADALLNLLLTLSMLDLWRYLESSVAAPARSPLRRAAVWVGLGLLTKGPIALLIPGATGMIWALLAGAAQQPQRWMRLRKALCDAPSWLLLMVTAGPWYLYAWHRHGMAFVDGFLMRHNVERFASTLESHGGSVVYYAVALPLLLLPWSPLLQPVISRARREWRHPLVAFLLGWAGFVFVFFSFSGTKLPHYVLYGATPLALLMARELPGIATTSRALRIALASAPFVLLAAWVGASWTLPGWATSIHEPLYRALLATPPGIAAPVALAGLAAASCAMLLGLSRIALERRLLAANTLAVLFVSGCAIPWWADLLQAPVKHAAEVARHAGGAAVQWHLHQPSFAFYLDQATPRRPPRAGELALMRESQLPPPGGWQEIHRERGLALIRWQGASTPESRP